MKFSQAAMEAIKRLVDIDRSSLAISERSNYDAEHVIVNRADVHELLRIIWSLGGQNIDVETLQVHAQGGGNQHERAMQLGNGTSWTIPNDAHNVEIHVDYR